MGKRGRKREREGRVTPTVDIKVVHADGDLRSLGALLKPALLYGDSVTVYSPTAYLLDAANNLSRLNSPIDQFDTMLDLAERMPTVFPQLDIDPSTADSLRAFLKVDRRRMRAAARAAGASSQFDDMYRSLDQLQAMWSTDFPRIVDELTNSRGGEDVRTAVESGFVTIAPLAAGTNPIAECLRVAAKVAPENAIDPILMDFLDRVAEVVTDERSFALVDRDARPLVRPLAPSDSTMRRSTEVSSAAGFAGYLPHFPRLPIDEVLDLRRDIQRPLTAFRAEMATMATEFEARPIDDDFDRELEDRWRRTVAPALAEVQDAFSSRGLLRSAAAIAADDVRRLSADAVGTILVSSSDPISLSGLMTAGLAIAAPIVDVAGRVVSDAIKERQSARRRGFYFLDHVDRAAQRRVA